MSSTASNAVSVAEQLFQVAPPRLLGSRCDECQSVFFPRRLSCRNPACRRTPPQKITLSDIGSLYSFTTQHYPAPQPFHIDTSLRPYTIVLVELPEPIRVLGLLAEGFDAESLRVGDTMELVSGRLYTREDGREVATWKFRPTLAVTRR
jgi:uncharacterized OB-fold protein